MKAEEITLQESSLCSSEGNVGAVTPALSVLVCNHSQTQKTKAVHEDKRTLVILPWELQVNTEYEFQVRARPREDTGYHGFWSEWSPLLTLKTSPAGTYCQVSLPFQLVQCQRMLLEL